MPKGCLHRSISRTGDNRSNRGERHTRCGPRSGTRWEETRTIRQVRDPRIAAALAVARSSPSVAGVAVAVLPATGRLGRYPELHGQPPLRRQGTPRGRCWRTLPHRQCYVRRRQPLPGPGHGRSRGSATSTARSECSREATAGSGLRTDATRRGGVDGRALERSRPDPARRVCRRRRPHAGHPSPPCAQPHVAAAAEGERAHVLGVSPDLFSYHRDFSLHAFPRWG